MQVFIVPEWYPVSLNLFTANSVITFERLKFLQMTVKEIQWPAQGFYDTSIIFWLFVKVQVYNLKAYWLLAFVDYKISMG